MPAWRCRSASAAPVHGPLQDWSLTADLLAAAFGLVPEDAELVDFLADDLLQGQGTAGEVSGGLRGGW